MKLKILGLSGDEESCQQQFFMIADSYGVSIQNKFTLKFNLVHNKTPFSIEHQESLAIIRDYVLVDGLDEETYQKLFKAYYSKLLYANTLQTTFIQFIPYVSEEEEQEYFLKNSFAIEKIYILRFTILLKNLSVSNDLFAVYDLGKYILVVLTGDFPKDYEQYKSSNPQKIFEFKPSQIFDHPYSLKSFPKSMPESSILSLFKNYGCIYVDKTQDPEPVFLLYFVSPSDYDKLPSSLKKLIVRNGSNDAQIMTQNVSQNVGEIDVIFVK